MVIVLCSRLADRWRSVLTLRRDLLCPSTLSLFYFPWTVFMCDVANLKDVSMERGVCHDRQPIHVEHYEGTLVPSDVTSHHHGSIWAREVFHGESGKRGG